jgi:hypothetical protein
MTSTGHQSGVALELLCSLCLPFDIAMSSRYPSSRTCTTCAIDVCNFKRHLAMEKRVISRMLRSRCAPPDHSNTANYTVRMTKLNQYIDLKVAGGYTRLGFWPAANSKAGNNDFFTSKSFR